MKISVNWLKEFTNIDLSVDELVEKIGSQVGEVEEVINLEEKYQGIKIVQVIKSDKHPNADKLSVCQIDTGKEKVQVVCGAPNVRTDMLAVWIPPGNTVPVTADKDPLVLEKREIRGEISNGMLASASELEIGDDHSGIVEVDKGKSGDDFAKTYGLDDHVIDIENKMFTHRPDCFGVLGVAREISGIQGKQFKSPEWYLGQEARSKKQEARDKLSVAIQSKVTKLVPRFMAVVISSVQVGPSPLWLKVRLASLGLKPINNIVDLTNYYMVLTGQPLHAYDYEKLQKVSGQKNVSLETRMSKKGEKLKLLGGKEITFDDDSSILITSNDVPVGIGGVMGGAETEVDEKTKTIVLECANFDLYSIRRTSMRYGLFTDAVTRFSKGQSPLQNDRILAKTLEDIEKISGGEVTNEIVDDNQLGQDLVARGSVHEPVQISAQFINERLGLNLKAEKIAKMLTNVEFIAEITRGDVLVVKAPFWRTDIEIPEDVVEEIGRLYGYDNLPLELPKRTSDPAVISKTLKLKQALASELAALGANEFLTHSFVHESLLVVAKQDKALAYKIGNALSPDLQYYRLSLTPSLLEKVHPNVKSGYDNFAVFETGVVHGKSEIDKDGLPKEFGRIALVYAAKKKSKNPSYYHAMTFLSGILINRFMSIELVPLTQNPIKDHKLFDQMIAPFDPARSALIYNGKSLLGVVGEFKEIVITKLKLPVQTAGFELFLSPLIDQACDKYTETSRYPLILQDITLSVDTKIGFGELQAGFDEAVSGSLPKDVFVSSRCIDIFSKDKSSKNTTFRIKAFSYDRTLTSDLLSDILDKAVAELKKKINATRI